MIPAAKILIIVSSWHCIYAHNIKAKMVWNPGRHGRFEPFLLQIWLGFNQANDMVQGILILMFYNKIKKQEIPDHVHVHLQKKKKQIKYSPMGYGQLINHMFYIFVCMPNALNLHICPARSNS